jgi:hypothetical protein
MSTPENVNFLEAQIKKGQARMEQLAPLIDEGANLLDSAALRELARQVELHDKTSQRFDSVVPSSVALGLVSILVNQTEFLRIGLENMVLRSLITQNKNEAALAELDLAISDLKDRVLVLETESI